MKIYKYILSGITLALFFIFAAFDAESSIRSRGPNEYFRQSRIFEGSGINRRKVLAVMERITVGKKRLFVAKVPIKFSEITPGMYVGATATKQPDGTFVASQINIFSEDQRGTGEGHRPQGAAHDDQCERRAH
jgi:hypothetical protein